VVRVRAVECSRPSVEKPGATLRVEWTAGDVPRCNVGGSWEPHVPAYRPSCRTENAAGVLGAPPTMSTCAHGRRAYSEPRGGQSAFRLGELSVPRSWHGRYHVCGVGWRCWGRLTHCSLARRGDAVGRWAFVAARTRWWHGLSVLWGTVNCHSRSTTDSFESTAAAGDADASSCGISAERPRGAPHARRCIRCCRGWR